MQYGDMDGWTLGSIISYDAQAVQTPLPDSEPEVEVKSPQCVEELISEVCFRSAAPVSQHLAFAHMHCTSNKPHGTERISAWCIRYVGLE